MNTLLWLPIGIVFTFLLYCSIPLIVANTRKKPISIGRLKWKCAFLIAVVFLSFSALMFISGDETYSPNATPAFFWGYVAYRLMKKRLHKRGLLVTPEDPVLEPVPPVEAVDYSSTLSEYTFIIPGEKKSAPQEPSANTAPTQPQVVGVQANIRGPIVAPVPATDTAPSKAEPVPQVAVPNKHTGLKVFSVVITCLFVAALGFAVQSQVALQNANAQVLQLEEEVNHLEYEAGVLRKNLENANATNSSLQKKAEDTLNSASKWLDAYVAIRKIGYIYDGYKNYHQLGCSRIGNYEQYWAHNIEYCEYLGYDPCPACWVIK